MDIRQRVAEIISEHSPQLQPYYDSQICECSRHVRVFDPLTYWTPQHLAEVLAAKLDIRERVTVVEDPDMYYDDAGNIKFSTPD